MRNAYEDAARIHKAYAMADLFDRYGFTADMVERIRQLAFGKDSDARSVCRPLLDEAARVAGIRPCSNTTLELVVARMRQRERVALTLPPPTDDPELDRAYEEFATPLVRA